MTHDDSIYRASIARAVIIIIIIIIIITVVIQSIIAYMSRHVSMALSLLAIIAIL